MHPLINQEIVETIRTTGNTSADLPARDDVLKKYHLPYDQPADNVVISGCLTLSSMPLILSSLARIFNRSAFSYTFLSEEYCCGNYFYRPVIKARDDEAMDECRALSKSFVSKNLQKARQLGAGRLIIFCSPCYPVYRHAFPDENIIFYPAAIAEVMHKARFKGQIDYYAGCYRLHKRIAPVTMDLASTNRVFANIADISINRISVSRCCYTPDGLSHMLEHFESETMVHICTGCYEQAFRNLPKDSQKQVMLLPQFVDKILAEQEGGIGNVL